MCWCVWDVIFTRTRESVEGTVWLVVEADGVDGSCGVALSMGE